jgi:hypothetical protein
MSILDALRESASNAAITTTMPHHADTEGRSLSTTAPSNVATTGSTNVIIVV